nr:hypothetical protein [Tanacetum cinerariifolium]
MVVKNERRVVVKQTGQGEPAVPEPSAPKAAKEAPDEPSPTKRLKGGLAGKRRKPKIPLKLVDEFADEVVPISEPRVDDEESDYQRTMKLSLKDLEARNQGPACTVVIQEPDFTRTQSLPEVQGKGKEKIIDGQVAYTLLDLNTLKKKSTADQDLTEINTRVQDEGQAGSNPGKKDKGQAGSNPCNAVEFQPQPSHVVHVGTNLEPMDLDFIDASTQQNPEQIDENFTDQFFMEKPQEKEPEKTSAELERFFDNACGKLGPLKSMKITIYEALEKSMDHHHSDQLQADLDEARKKCRKRPDSPRTPSGSPPPPPPSLGAFGASGSLQLPPPPLSSSSKPVDFDKSKQQKNALGASDSTKLLAATHQSSAWTISDTRDKPSGSFVHHFSPPKDQQMDDDLVPFVE